MNADGLLELLDVLGAALAKGSLGLAVPLLAFLRGCVDLGQHVGVSPVCLAASCLAASALCRFGRGGVEGREANWE